MKGDTIIELKPIVKYFGLMIKSRIRFLEQIKTTADEVTAGVSALSRLMINVGGPASRRRRAFMSVMQSILFTVWRYELMPLASP